jgi:hypothetical protein
MWIPVSSFATLDRDRTRPSNENEALRHFSQKPACELRCDHLMGDLDQPGEDLPLKAARYRFAAAVDRDRM